MTLPDSDTHLLHADCKLHDDIEVQVGSTDTLINKLAAQDPSVKWLISLPRHRPFSLCPHPLGSRRYSSVSCQAFRELYRAVISVF